MLRTWLVRLDAIEFTESVRSRQVPATPGTRAWPPSMPSVPTSRATRVTSSANDDSWSTIVLTVLLSSRISPARVDGDLAGQVAAGDRGRDLGDVADLRGEVRRHHVDVLGEVLPRAGDVVHVRLPAEPPSVPTSRATRVTSSANDDSWSTMRVDRRLELEDLAARLDGDRAGQVAPGDRGRDLGDVADLRGEVAGHEVHRVGQVPPGARHPGYGGLAAQPALAADLAGHPGHLVGERRELVDHDVDGRLQLRPARPARRP